MKIARIISNIYPPIKILVLRISVPLLKNNEKPKIVKIVKNKNRENENHENENHENPEN